MTSCPGTPSVLKSFDIGWAAYEKNMSEQQRWYRNSSDLKTLLRHALPRLPNLCRSTVACCPTPYELRRGFFQGPCGEIFLESLASPHNCYPETMAGVADARIVEHQAR
jgi:hypothetical protein